MKHLRKILIIAASLSSSYSFSNSDIVGQWRSIDDKTGFSKAIIEITQDAKGEYNGKIIDLTPRPGYTPKAHCDRCKGNEKNKPIVGLQILKNMKRSTKNTLEFNEGTILDPLSGTQYRTTLRLNASGSRLSIRGFVGVEALGRSQTWLRHN